MLDGREIELELNSLAAGHPSLAVDQKMVQAQAEPGIKYSMVVLHNTDNNSYENQQGQCGEEADGAESMKSHAQ